MFRCMLWIQQKKDPSTQCFSPPESVREKKTGEKKGNNDETKYGALFHASGGTRKNCTVAFRDFQHSLNQST